MGFSLQGKPPLDLTNFKLKLLLRALALAQRDSVNLRSSSIPKHLLHGLPNPDLPPHSVFATLQIIALTTHPASCSSPFQKKLTCFF